MPLLGHNLNNNNNNEKQKQTTSKSLAHVSAFTKIPQEILMSPVLKTTAHAALTPAKGKNTYRGTQLTI